MTRNQPLAMAFAALLLAGCGRSGGAAPAAPETGSTPPATVDAGNATLADNDRAIADNKRMIATLGRYQAEDFAQYERLRTACEAQVHGTLVGRAAPAVARCIEAGWPSPLRR